MESCDFVIFVSAKLTPKPRVQAFIWEKILGPLPRACLGRAPFFAPNQAEKRLGRGKEVPFPSAAVCFRSGTKAFKTAPKSDFSLHFSRPGFPWGSAWWPRTPPLCSSWPGIGSGPEPISPPRGCANPSESGPRPLPPRVESCRRPTAFPGDVPGPGLPGAGLSPVPAR